MGAARPGAVEVVGGDRPDAGQGKKIVFVRTQEVERNITVTLAHIKKMAEGVIWEPS